MRKRCPPQRGRPSRPGPVPLAPRVARAQRQQMGPWGRVAPSPGARPSTPRWEARLAIISGGRPPRVGAPAPFRPRYVPLRAWEVSSVRRTHTGLPAPSKEGPARRRRGPAQGLEATRSRGLPSPIDVGRERGVLGKPFSPEGRKPSAPPHPFWADWAQEIEGLFVALDRFRQDASFPYDPRSGLAGLRSPFSRVVRGGGDTVVEISSEIRGPASVPRDQIPARSLRGLRWTVQVIEILPFSLLERKGNSYTILVYFPKPYSLKTLTCPSK